MKKNIALVTGGYSGESVISYKSAATIFEHLDRSKWNVFLIDINVDGWFYTDDNNHKISIDKNDFTLQIESEKIRFDSVMIGLHGTPGEDGKLQGYFDCLNIPYTSCDVTSSAITFNKRYTVAVAAFAGIPVAKSMHLFKHTSFVLDELLKELTLPVFVKPNNGGSSLGMSKVNQPEDLSSAIAKAFDVDDQVLVEEYISGREFTIGVFKTKGEIITLPITEIVTQNEFFDFQAKYEGASEEITPAKITDDMATKICMEAKKAYQVFNCNGVVRIDFIYNKNTDKPFLLEINTVPGQSAASIIPQQVKAMGWSLTEFYSKLLEECF
jgi:D-alanine-D-alanine ligase